MNTKRRRAGDDDRALEATLARLRPRAEARPGWEDGFAARVLARAQGEIARRAVAPSLWQLLARWPAPLVPAAAAVLALAIVLAGNGGFSTSPGLQDGSDVQAALRGDPLSAVVTDPVLALIAAEATGEVTP
jgi:hypothetical protein